VTWHALINTLCRTHCQKIKQQWKNVRAKYWSEIGFITKLYFPLAHFLIQNVIILTYRHDYLKFFSWDYTNGTPLERGRTLKERENFRVGHGSLLTDPTRPDPTAHGPNPTRPIATVRPTDLHAYLLITFASVTDCLKSKRFIRKWLIYTENNFSRTSNSLNCVNFTITFSVTFCIIQGDPHRSTQMDPNRPNPLSKEKIWTRPDPWMDPTHVQLCGELGKRKCVRMGMVYEERKGAETGNNGG